MFIGHAAVGLASKQLAPRVSLGTLIAAPFALDVIWPLLVLAGAEHFRVDPGNTAFTHLDFYDYPWSHSLLMAAVWSLLFAAGHFASKRDRRAAIVLAAGVISHWLFDFITHRPDLPLFPGGPKTGLGLWNSRPGTLLVELALFATGVALYLRHTRALNRAGSIAFWALIVTLLLIYGANAMTIPPPETSTTGIAISALLIPLFFIWAAWVDRRREVRV